MLAIDWQEARMYINGQWKEAQSKLSVEVENPATGEVIGKVPDGGEYEAKIAVEAAYSAFPSWSALPARERSRLLYRWYEKIIESKDDLAMLMTLEQGKPLTEAHGEINYGSDFILWYAEEANRVYGEIVPALTQKKRIWALRQPVGVVAAVTPWNFPFAMITRKAAPALAAGCTVVVKPAKQTPLTALALVKLAEEAGIPSGVLNVVTTNSASTVVGTWLQDQRVRKISFTGSTEVGKILMRQAADQMKRVSLELGGHAPVLVFDDANLDKSISGVMACKFRNAGQACIAGNRFLVDEKVVDTFIKKLTKAMQGLKIGSGWEEGVTIGPLIDRESLEKVEMQVQDAVSKGARVVYGGKRINDRFFQPTLLSDVTTDMLIAREETFGPVIPIMPFTEQTEAIRMANDTAYGLAAYVFTENYSRAIQVSEALQFGIVGLNDGAPSAAQAPFGGMKESGVGREGGHWGIAEYLEIKYVSVGL